MKLMSHAVVKFHPDNALQLPTSITQGMVNSAVLPMKIEHARKAIAACTDLSELLRYKSQAEGLAAAVRTMKEVGPELIKRANEMMADAWRKGGELLSAYSAGTEKIKGSGVTGYVRADSARSALGASLGLSKRTVTSLVRFAASPKPAAYKAAERHTTVDSAAAHVPPVRMDNRRKYSDALRLITVSDKGSAGLNYASSALRRIDLTQFKHLTPDERKVVKAKIVEIQELLDEMDRLCR